MTILSEITHRGVTATHYSEGKKYMIWYYKADEPSKTIGVVQVRGLNKPLTEDELKVHIDKLWDRYHAEQEKSNS
jgi:hypothetical protein